MKGKVDKVADDGGAFRDQFDAQPFLQVCLAHVRLPP